MVSQLPGYGISTPIQDPAHGLHSKRAVGTALLEALSSIFQATSTRPRRIVLGGHDRGARIGHRLAVDFSHPPPAWSSTSYDALHLTVLGAILLDIVPTSAQWAAFADPAISAGYFHWPLLANAELATEMIAAFGGARWATLAHSRIAGPHPDSMARIAADGALDVYAGLFAERDTLYHSALDYAAGAAPEATEQDEDQAAGRQVGVPLLVMFSTAKLGARIDVAGEWKNWVAPGVDYQGYGVEGGYGHYLPEEAYDVVVPQIEAFLKKYT